MGSRISGTWFGMPLAVLLAQDMYHIIPSQCTRTACVLRTRLQRSEKRGRNYTLHVALSANPRWYLYELLKRSDRMIEQSILRSLVVYSSSSLGFPSLSRLSATVWVLCTEET
jgi:hypothetical protein